MKVEFYKHNLNAQDAYNVGLALNDPILTTGKKVKEFEMKFSQYIGCRYTIGVMSCTAALHLSLLAYGIGKGCDVITTPMTFIATANAILHTGAKPVFVDVEPETGNVDANLIESAITRKTKAIMPVHLYGQVCNMRVIKAIAGVNNLIVVEDAAHAIEADRDGIKPGELGDIATFSFYGTKSLTAGESGAVCTNAEWLAKLIRKLSLHGMSSGAGDRYSKRYQHWDMEMLGWKANMSNIQAALLLGQIDRLEGYWQRRNEIARRYEEAFRGIIECPKVLPDSKHARHLFTIWVESKRRDEIMGKLQDKGIGVAVNYRAIHLLSYYQRTFGYKRGIFPVAEKIGDSTISLPLYPKLTDEEVEYIIKSVKECVK
jgi:dTDP-4-amino-4,6-dideoxygalactose transaminase